MKVWSRYAVAAAILLITAMAIAGNVLGEVDQRTAGLEEVMREIEENRYSWTAGHTEISDLSSEELTNLLGLRVPDHYEGILEELRHKSTPWSPIDLPLQFDWTDSAAVSPVRRQRCGDCWAQCSVAAMESQLRIHDDDITRLSVQQGIDCNFGNSDCGGGWWDDVYDLYMAVGAVTQVCFPYRNGVDGPCDQDTCEIVAVIDGYESIDTSVESIKSSLMTYGPIAVAMSVYNSFNYYSGGCYETSLSGDINHGVLIVGWDDSMCSGDGAWHIKNSWGTGWGESGYAWMKYGTADIGYGACIIHYTPRERTTLEYESHLVDDSGGNGNGFVDAGEAPTLQVSLENYRWDTATGVSATLMTSTPGIQVPTSSATFPDMAGGAVEESEAPHFVLAVDASVPCGRRVHFTISVECDQGSYSDNFELLIGGSAATIFSDGAETDMGWTLGAPDDDASTGRWTLKNPRGSEEDGHLVQAEIDHTPGSGYLAFVTANAPRAFVPDFGDVDGGKTSLMTPVFDLSDKASATVKYWKWYTNDTGDSAADDTWMVDVSADGGLTWVNLETQTDSYREWKPYDFDLGEYVPLTNQVVLRFVASDYGDQSIVEAAVDDFELTGCPASVDVLAPYVEVISPNGGEELTEGTEVQVDWALSDDYGFRGVIVLASYDGGTTYDDTLRTMTGFDTNLTWQIPAGDHPECKIGVEATDRGYSTSFDESDMPFAIVRDQAGIDDIVEESTPDRVVLVGSERNPFSGSTHIFFGLPSAMETTLRVYDARGRLTKEILNSGVQAGYHSVVWDGRGTSGRIASSGVYFLRLTAGDTVRTTKVMLVR